MSVQQCVNKWHSRRAGTTRGTSVIRRDAINSLCVGLKYKTLSHDSCTGLDWKGNAGFGGITICAARTTYIHSHCALSGHDCFWIKQLPFFFSSKKLPLVWIFQNKIPHLSVLKVNLYLQWLFYNPLKTTLISTGTVIYCHLKTILE